MIERIAQLEAQLVQALSQREEIDALNELAWELVRYRQVERAAPVLQKAHDLSISGEFSTAPYTAGIASSLTTRAYLDRQQGKYDQALNECLQALALLDPDKPSPAAIDSLRLIGWIYLYLGDYSKALTHALKALTLAQVGGLKSKEASVLDGLARIYITHGDTELATQAHTEALTIARACGDKMLEAVTLNNFADTLREMGEHARALALGNQSLAIAQQLGLSQRSEICDTLGQILKEMGNYERAEQLLNESLAMDVEAGEEMGVAFSYFGLGELYLSQGDLERAEANFRRALEHANLVGARPIQMDCYAKLTELAEQQKNWELAFAYHKAFHAINQEIHSESSGQRIAILKVGHQVETAKRDAEIYHLRNEELLREIEERKRMEQALQELAMTDPLTGLFNRRHFFNMAEIMLAQAIRYKHPLSIMVMDIDYFKQVNDTYGHATGDEAIKFLATNIRRTIRAVDVAARFGGDEFVLMLPETNLHQAMRTAERLQRFINENTITANDQALRLTLSIGISSTSEQQAVTVIDTLLEQADRALYSAKHKGRNQAQVWSAEA